MLVIFRKMRGPREEYIASEEFINQDIQDNVDVDVYLALDVVVNIEVDVDLALDVVVNIDVDLDVVVNIDVDVDNCCCHCLVARTEEV